LKTERVIPINPGRLGGTFRDRCELVSTRSREGEAMPAKDGPKVFHATMHVTRIEEWFVEANSADEAKQLLESGQGERAHLGECLQIDFAELSN
jgi:hypothetical protein